MSNVSWEKIFNDYNISAHDFSKEPFYISADEIKESTKVFIKTKDREVRLLCKQDTRESRPDVFKKHGLFILPVKNGHYAIIKGEGYLDIPNIDSNIVEFQSRLRFKPSSCSTGDSEMQHIDYAFATGLIHEYLQDNELVLTIRGRKYTPAFHFNVSGRRIESQSVQTEVDAGYESESKIVLIEVKNSKTSNVITRQLYYPYRQWKEFTGKEVIPLFFEKREDEYHIWRFEFGNKNSYESIRLVDSKKFIIV